MALFRTGEVISNTVFHIASASVDHSHPRLLMALFAVPYRLRLPKPFVTIPSINQANDGMCLGNGLPVAIMIAIAPRYEPVFNRVPIDVFVWSPISEPTFVDPVSIDFLPSSMTETLE